MTKKKQEKIENMDDVFSNLKKEIDAKNAELKAKSKPYDSLIVPIDCKVIEVNGKLHTSSITVQSEVVIGGQMPSYKAGHSSNLELKVKTETPIQTITFKGWPPIEAGDLIRAYIFKGKKAYKERSFFEQQCTYPHTEPEPLYIEREFEQKEKALKIEKIKKGRTVATYHN